MPIPYWIQGTRGAPIFRTPSPWHPMFRIGVWRPAVPAGVQGCSEECSGPWHDGRSDEVPVPPVHLPRVTVPCIPVSGCLPQATMAVSSTRHWCEHDSGPRALPFSTEVMPAWHWALACARWEGPLQALHTSTALRQAPRKVFLNITAQTVAKAGRPRRRG